MTHISEEKIYERWDTLPQTLRQALVAEVNSDFIWKTCESEHIPDEKIYNVGRAASHVLLGFIHPGDLAQELKEVLGINQQLADSVASKINERVFKPLGADLEKIYEPPAMSRVELPSALAPAVSTSTPLSASKVEPPKPIIQEIRPLKVQVSAAPETKLPFFTQPIQKPPAPTVSAPKPTAPMSPTPAPSAFRGVPVRAPAPPVPLTPPIKPSRVEPFDSTQGEPLAVSPSTQLRVNQPEPGPKIIHEEPSSTVPLKSVERFKTEMAQPKFSEVKVKSNISAKPAVLEFGSTGLTTSGGSAPKTGAPSLTIPKVVHYTEFRAPVEKNSLSATPMPVMPKPLSASEREIKEITAPPAATSSFGKLSTGHVETTPPKTVAPMAPEVKQSTPPVAPPTVQKMPPPPPPVVSRIEPPRPPAPPPAIPPKPFDVAQGKPPTPPTPPTLRA